MIKNNVNYVAENAVCTGCGACSGICPVKAIQMKRNAGGFLYAEVNDKACISCARCLNTCVQIPGNLNEEKENAFQGNIIKGYIGYASDDKIRLIGQSGGVITALLKYLLEKQKIDGAIVTSFNSKEKMPEATYLNNAEQLHMSAGSYYVQSPTAEKAILANDKRVAMVGVGCQIESIYKAYKNRLITNYPEYSLGLICAGQQSSKEINELLRMAGVDNKENIKGFRFRDKRAGGWPGNVAINTENKKYVLNKNKRIEIKPAFESFACLACYNQMNYYADIVFGDPWGVERDIKGKTVFLTRTEKGEKLIEEAVKEGYINVKEVSISGILEGQTIEKRLIPQFYAVQRIFQENKWLYPYCKNNGQQGQMVDKDTYKKLEKKLKDARKLYLSATEKEADRIIWWKVKKAQYEFKIGLLNNFYRRGIRFFRKRIWGARSGER